MAAITAGASALLFNRLTFTGHMAIEPPFGGQQQRCSLVTPTITFLCGVLGSRARNGTANMSFVCGMQGLMLGPVRNRVRKLMPHPPVTVLRELLLPLIIRNPPLLIR